MVSHTRSVSSRSRSARSGGAGKALVADGQVQVDGAVERRTVLRAAVVIGGLSLLGYQAERMISNFHVDMAICSCKGIDSANGITDSNEQDAEIKKAFFRNAKKRVLAVDSTKFDKSSFVKICDISDVDLIVTEKRPSDFWLENLKSANVELLYEPVPEE